MFCLLSPTIKGPSYIVQWTSKFTRNLDTSGLSGKVYAFSDMVDRMSLPREFYEPYVDSQVGAVGFEDCESLCAQLKRQETQAEEFSARQFSGIP